MFCHVSQFCCFWFFCQASRAVQSHRISVFRPQLWLEPCISECILRKSHLRGQYWIDRAWNLFWFSRQIILYQLCWPCLLSASLLESLQPNPAPRLSQAAHTKSIMPNDWLKFIFIEFFLLFLITIFEGTWFHSLRIILIFCFPWEFRSLCRFSSCHPSHANTRAYEMFAVSKLRQHPAFTHFGYPQMAHPEQALIVTRWFSEDGVRSQSSSSPGCHLRATSE